jgi:hypothetical protein
VTHAHCPRCRLRFSRALSASLPTCPWCNDPLEPLLGPEGAVGMRLFTPGDVPRPAPRAAAVAISLPPVSRLP